MTGRFIVTCVISMNCGTLAGLPQEQTSVPSCAGSGLLAPQRLPAFVAGLGCAGWPIAVAEKATAAAGILAAASASAAAWKRQHQRRRRRTCSVRRMEASPSQTAQVIPSDYYSLLGLSRSVPLDDDALRSAHRRLVKLVHPDVLGCDADSGRELLELVNKAYRTLSDKESRKEYAIQIGAPYDAGSRHSVWNADAPKGAKGVFVDEPLCIRCHLCMDCAPSTFVLDDECENEEEDEECELKDYDVTGRARVVEQYADEAVDIDWAVKGCPTEAIYYVDKNDLMELEDAVTECTFEDSHLILHRFQENLPPSGGSAFDIYRQDRSGKRKTAERDPATAEMASSIKAAVAALPDVVRRKAWADQKYPV